MPRLRSSVHRSRFAAAAATVAVTAVSLVTFAAAPARAVVPSAPVALPTAIEDMPPYQPQTFCDPVAKRGTKALANLLTSTYQGTAIVSLARPCNSESGTSEHKDGRAIDWGVNVANTKQRAQGKAFLKWLFAPDAAGDTFAMVRRLGVMYVIWNKRIWGGWDHSWSPYSCSGVTACHQDHMHLSLDWSGALRKTSFWTGRVTAPMPPPLRALKAMHAPQSMKVSLHDADPQPQFKVLGGARYRFAVTGTYHYDGVRHHRADAECSTVDATHWAPLTATETDATTGLLDLWVNGRSVWNAESPVGGCSTTHRYNTTVTFPTTAPLVVSINDSARWSGDGSLTVTVERVG